MIPTRTLLLLLLGPSAVSVLGVVNPLFRAWGIVADLIFVAVALLDLLSLPRRSQLSLARGGEHNLSVGQRNHFTLTVHNRSGRRLAVRVTESLPEELEAQGLPASGWIGAHARGRFGYVVVPHRRGSFDFGRSYLRARSLLGLWERQLRVTLEHPVRVFPNVKQVNTYALLARRNRIDMIGFRATRSRAADVEFDRLREYQPDDDHRRIDPFASARHRRLITRDYQVSRNQNVFFMVDCGRLMAAESGGLSNLDHALDATLMLSYLALEAGDNVGLMAFDRELRAFLPPAGGMARKTTILRALYDLQPAAEDPDYEHAFLTLHRRVRQRSLVVLVTNVMDDASFGQLRPHLSVSSRRHLPLVLLLRDEDLFRMADAARPETIAGFFEVGAAAELASWREQMATRLSGLGALVLDITPRQATPQLINRYLQIKAEQLL